jgi:hypothetical protein
MEIKRYTSSSKLLADLNKHGKNWIFRGHANSEWEIASLVSRDAKRLSKDIEEFEREALIGFKRRGRGLAPQSERPKGMLEWLALLQHHGGPTRLIDFTYSYWVALFFATEFALGDCALFLLDTTPLLAEKKRETVNHDNLLSCLLGMNKIHYFIKKNHTSIQMCIPTNLNTRIAIQQGLFIYQTNIKDSFLESCNTPSCKVQLKKIIVDESIVKDLKMKLSKTNCISSVLFPGIDGFARSMRNYHS